MSCHLHRLFLLLRLFVMNSSLFRRGGCRDEEDSLLSVKTKTSTVHRLNCTCVFNTFCKVLFCEPFPLNQTLHSRDVSRTERRRRTVETGDPTGFFWNNDTGCCFWFWPIKIQFTSLGYLLVLKCTIIQNIYIKAVHKPFWYIVDYKRIVSRCNYNSYSMEACL